MAFPPVMNDPMEGILGPKGLPWDICCRWSYPRSPMEWMELGVKPCSRFDVGEWLNFGSPELDFEGGLGDGGEELEWGKCQERENHQ
jgi:hypothetical protein